ncbi:MAG TPA: protein kinase [Candidatus Eremiobacteraeota bacterium]|nr:MAG: Serine/threonine-protein kinase PknB [bacterium ADurb.Bin363]HPZ08050.1 protein kinase [Candidatus Eremiobacteraeota bacterium]
MLEILEAGCILNNRYEIRDLILCDEKEVHYLVEDLNPPHEQLTVKEIIPHSQRELDGTPEFWNRLSVLSETSHPNLVKIYEFFSEIPEGKSDKRHYIVMETVKGRTLQDIFQMDLHEEPLPTKMLLKHMVKVCSALKYLNTQHSPPAAFGVLKPKYIMLTPERQIKLFNYGLGSLLRTGVCSKVPGFAALEQITQGVIDEKTDIFSLAATMHYLLTGRNPEDNPRGFDPITDYNQDVTPELNELILKCLSPEPKKRPGLQEVSNFLLRLSMGKRPKSLLSPLSAQIAGPDKVTDVVASIKEKLSKKHIIPPSVISEKPPLKDKKKKEEKEQVEELYDFSTEIAEPEQPETVDKVDIFTLSKEEKPVPPASVPTTEQKTPDLPQELSDDKFMEEVKSKFQSAPKRGTRRFDVKHFMATAEALKSKRGESPENLAETEMAEQKAKESRQKSAELFARLTAGKKPSPTEEIFPENVSTMEETPATEDPSPHKEVETPGVEETLLFTKETKPVPPSTVSTPSIPEKSAKTEDQTVTEVEGKKELSLAQKLAQKYARKKQDDKEQKADTGELIKETIRKPQIAGDWKEQKRAMCQPKPDTPPILSPLKEGTVLKNRYEIAEVIHTDCYGAVYMALDLEEDEESGTDARRAIKEIQYKPPSDNYRLGERIISNFVRVAGKLKNLDHPNLVKIKDYFFNYSGDRSTLRLFIVMELVEGYTLEHIIKTHLQKQSRISSETTFAMVTKVCEALYYLHTQKPPVTSGFLNVKNILISYNGDVKFLNYGLREIFIVEQELVYPYYGILGYVAPEQTGLDITNTKSDIFALGATIYYLLTGINPEQKPYEFVPARKVNPYISPNVEELIELCIKVNPAERGNIKLIKEKMGKIKLVELDSSLMEQQKEAQEKRKASMGEMGNITPLTFEFAKFFAKYAAIIITIVTLIIGGYIGVNWYANRTVKGPKLYILSKSDKIIKILDLNTKKINQEINIPFKGTILAGTLKKKQLLITDGSTIYIIDTVSKKITGKFSGGMDISFMLLSPDETKLYLLSNKANKFKVIDLMSKSFIAEKDILPGSVDAALTADGGKFFIINNSGDQSFLSIYETSSWNLLNKITIAKSPDNIDITSNGEKAFIVYKSEDSIGIVDISSSKIEMKKLGSDTDRAGPIKIKVSPKNDELYVLNLTRKEIATIKIADFVTKTRIPLEGYPNSMVLFPVETAYIYTSQINNIGKRSYYIDIIDIANSKLLSRIQIKTSINHMAISED